MRSFLTAISPSLLSRSPFFLSLTVCVYRSLTHVIHMLLFFFFVRACVPACLWRQVAYALAFTDHGKASLMQGCVSHVSSTSFPLLFSIHLSFPPSPCIPLFFPSQSRVDRLRGSRLLSSLSLLCFFLTRVFSADPHNPPQPPSHLPLSPVAGVRAWGVI